MGAENPPLKQQGWQSGWFSSAKHLKSPNMGARPSGVAIDLIVIHAISLPPGEYGGEGVKQLFTNQLDWSEHPYYETIRGLEVSAHFFIRRNGALWQFVSCDQRAWHAGQSHYRGRNNCNDYSIGIELEGLEGQTFEDAQYATLTQVCEALKTHYPIAHIAGHEHIAPGRKGDPGAGFDWPRLQNSLALPPTHFPKNNTWIAVD